MHWILGCHQVSFMELALDFELNARRALPASLGALIQEQRRSLREPGCSNWFGP